MHSQTTVSLFTNQIHTHAHTTGRSYRGRERDDVVLLHQHETAGRCRHRPNIRLIFILVLGGAENLGMHAELAFDVTQAVKNLQVQCGTGHIRTRWTDPIWSLDNERFDVRRRHRRMKRESKFPVVTGVQQNIKHGEVHGCR